MNTICDWTTLTQCATVDNSNNFHVDAPTGSNLSNLMAASIPGQTATNCITNAGYTTGQPNPVNADQNGQLCVDTSLSSYSNKANWVEDGTAATTGAGSTQVIAAPVSGKLYIKRIQCSNSGSTASLVTFNNAGTTHPLSVMNGAGTGFALGFDPPLTVATTTAFNANFITASTSQYCSAQGYNAP
jgi:hypothetical protein